MQSLILNEAALPGLEADGLEALGNVFLRRVHATGEVRLLGIRVGGNLSCDGAWFETEGDEALSADGMETRGSVFLRDVHASGEVGLIGARIGVDLLCTGGKFEKASGRALIAQGARVTGALFWREGSHATGAIDLTGAEIGVSTTTPLAGRGQAILALNRCRYGAFTGKGVSGDARIRWLDLQSPARFGDDFWPQPWEHCAKVLREMGHAEDARQVLIAKEKRQRAARRARLRKETQGTWRHAQAPLYGLGDALLGAFIAYGHKPLRAGLWLLLMFAIGWGMFGVAYGNGGFKPNNAFILSQARMGAMRGRGRAARRSPLDAGLLPRAATRPRATRPSTRCSTLLDTLVPVVDLEVQDYWVPDERAAGWARVYLWAHIAAGWALTLLAVAGFSGLVQSRATEE